MAPLEISLSPSARLQFRLLLFPFFKKALVGLKIVNFFSQIGRCGCVGAVAAPRNLVKPRKEESSSGKDISGGRKSSKDKTTPSWKKLDASSEFGIQRSMIPESTRMVLNKLRKKGLLFFFLTSSSQPLCCVSKLMFSPKNITFFLSELIVSGFQVYLVGGCVRDLILDRIPKDFDVITSAELKEV